MKKLTSYILLLLASACSLSSCHKDDDDGDTSSRALLMYMVAENSLARFADEDINEILAGASKIPNKDVILLYFDGLDKPAIYKITNQTKASKLSDLTPVYSYSEDPNSCSKETLSGFMTYAKKNISADSYAMIFWSHGSGWIPSTYYGDTKKFAPRKAFGVDNGKNIGKGDEANEGNQLCISDLHSVLQSWGQKFDYIMFDCCFMQCIEVSYELRDVTKYFIASPAEIPAPGNNYTVSMSAFFNKTDYYKAIPEAYYNVYVSNLNYGVLISTVDCSYLDQLAAQTKSVVAAHKDDILAMSYDDVLHYFLYDRYRSKICHPHFYDMNAVFKKALPESEYATWKKAFDKAVPYAYATDTWYSEYPKCNLPVDKNQFGGVTMFIPLDKYKTDGYASSNALFLDAFSSTQWAKAVWPE